MIVGYRPKFLWVTSERPHCHRLGKALRRMGYRVVALPVQQSSQSDLLQAERFLPMIDGIAVFSRDAAAEVARIVSRNRWDGVLFCDSQYCAAPLRQCHDALVRVAPASTEAGLVQLIREHWAEPTTSAPAGEWPFAAIANDNGGGSLGAPAHCRDGGDGGDDLPPSAA